MWEEDPQQNNIDVAPGQPPNNVQPIKMQQIIPQQTDQDQHNNSTQQPQDAVHQQNVQGYHGLAPMRTQPQPQTQPSTTKKTP